MAIRALVRLRGAVVVDAVLMVRAVVVRVAVLFITMDVVLMVSDGDNAPVAYELLLVAVQVVA